MSDEEREEHEAKEEDVKTPEEEAVETPEEEAEVKEPVKGILEAPEAEEEAEPAEEAEENISGAKIRKSVEQSQKEAEGLRASAESEEEPPE